MPAPRTRDEALELVLKSGVTELDEATLARLLEVIDPDTSPADTLHPLVRAGHLNQWQAEQLLKGKWKGFRIGPYKILGESLIREEPQRFMATSHGNQSVELLLVPVWLRDFPPTDHRLTTLTRTLNDLTKFTHPNIARIFEVVAAENCSVVVQEVRVGEHLRQVLERVGHFPFGEACGAAVQIASALQSAHEAGLRHVHHNLGQLWASRAGLVKLHNLTLDWLFNSDTYGIDVFPAHLSLESLPYISPEAPGGDCRVDVFSLGAILYHLLAGAPPFEPVGWVAPVSRYPNPIGRPEVPEALTQVVMKMLAQKPVERYRSMTEVIAALRPFVVPSPTGSCPPMAATAIESLAK